MILIRGGLVRALRPQSGKELTGQLVKPRWSSRPWFIHNYSSAANEGNNNKSEPLPSEKDSQRSEVSKWMYDKMDKFQATIFTAGRTLNDITGYSSIETLRNSIQEQENYLRKCKDEVAKYKEKYTGAISKRSASQREVNELLQRKHQWSPNDLERFTELYRNDHANEQEETEAEQKLNSAENKLEEGRNELSRLIGSRYHEEQIWSDKIRRASTYGTWVLMGFNVILFIVVQLGLEPWKRRRLVGSFEEKVKTALDDKLIGASSDTEVPASVDEEESTPASEEELSEPGPGLRWRNFPSRVVNAIEQASAFIVTPSELVVSISFGATLGMLLGMLTTLAFMK